MSPPPAGGGDTRRAGQTRVATSRPAAKRLSAPVLARPRTASHDSRPAIRAPPTIGGGRVDGDEERVGARVPDGEVGDRHREPSAGAGEHGDDRAPVRVQERRKHQFGAESLHGATEQGQRAPLVADESGDGRREQLAEQRGTRLADDERGEHPGEQPEAAADGLKPGKQRLKRARHRVGCDVPDHEDQSARDADDARHDDVDDPPAESVGRAVGGGCC